MFHYHLQNLSLSKKEARVYLALLELGPSTVQEIARKTGLVRTTVYNQIKTLIEKGLLTGMFQGKKRLIIGQNPNRLLSNLRFQKKELEEQERILKDIIPDLKGLINLSKGSPKIRTFIGKEGIRLMREDMIKTKRLPVIEEFIPIDEVYRFYPPNKNDHRDKMIKALNRTRRKVISASVSGIKLPAIDGLIENSPTTGEAPFIERN